VRSVVQAAANETSGWRAWLKAAARMPMVTRFSGRSAPRHPGGVPAPEGFAEARVRPAAASFSKELGEFILPYDAVRAAADPRAALMDFLQSTYDAAADLGKWDRRALECTIGEPRVVRQF